MVSIVFVNWNTLKDIAETIFCIEQNPPRVDREYLIIDNGSDDYAEWVKSPSAQEGTIAGIPLAHMGIGRNLGFGCGANMGIILARGKYVCLCNPDLRPDPGWLDTLVQHIEEHPDVGIAAPASDNVCNRRQLEAVLTMEVSNLDMFEYIPFVCVLIPKHIFRYVGLMNVWYGEDFSYCARVQNREYKIAIVGTARIHHILNSSFRNNEIGFDVTKQTNYMKDVVEPRFLGV